MCPWWKQASASSSSPRISYTTVGYGDVLPSPTWRLVGPIEAAVGVLMLGLAWFGAWRLRKRAPPRWLLDTAAEHGLRVMVGLPWGASSSVMGHSSGILQEKSAF